MSYDPQMEALAVIGAIAVAWFVIACIRGWVKSGERLEEIRQRNAGKPSSWEGSAEQKQLHAAGEMSSWSSQPPY